MLEFLNTFLMKGAYIYFGHKDKVYVISKQLIVGVFGVCVKGYVEELKGQVNKSLTIQALQSCRLAPINSSIDQWNAKSMGLPYSIRCPTIIFFIYHSENILYFSNDNAITLVSRKEVEGRLGTYYIQ